jgi:hypothetical protein
MCAGVAGFVLAYHDSPRRCCLWIEVTPTEREFPLSTAYIVADYLQAEYSFSQLTGKKKEEGRF